MANADPGPSEHAHHQNQQHENHHGPPAEREVAQIEPLKPMTWVEFVLKGRNGGGGGNTEENEQGRQRSLPEEEKDRGPDRGR